MLASVRSAGILGIDAYIVDVEVDSTSGLPAISTVGLAQSAVKEGKERVLSAIQNSGFEVPPRRITINLAPADVKKEGSHYDLPIACGLLAATGQLRVRLALPSKPVWSWPASWGSMGRCGRFAAPCRWRMR